MKPTHHDFRPRGAAREIFRRRDDEVGLSGPAGTGKSRAILEKLHAVAEKYDGSRQLLIRKTRASLESTSLVTYEQLVLPPGNAELTYQQATYPNGSIITFGGLDKASKIMSSEYDIIAVPEATELTEDDWESLTTRLRWGRLPYQQMLFDCNPGPPTHFLRRRMHDGKLVMLASQHEDNPRLYNGYCRKHKTIEEGWTCEGTAYMRKLDALTGVRYLRLRRGVWAAAEGMVYHMWNPGVHLVDRFEIPKEWPRIWSIDFGYTNPFVWAAWAIGHDGRLYRYREIYQTHRTVREHAGAIMRAERGEPYPLAVICDHDAEDRATFEQETGLATLPAYKTISPGVQAVQDRLKIAGDGRPRLLFLRDSLVERDERLIDAKLPTCTEEEIEAYVWPKPKPTSGRGLGEAPVKKDDHGMDNMRYCVAFVDNLAIAGAPELEIITEDYGREISPY